MENRINLTEYADKPWELDSIPESYFTSLGISKSSYIASAIGDYELRKNAYKPLNVDEADMATAAVLFWKNWETFALDKDNFHTAFDSTLQKLHALSVFDKDGNLKNRKTYSFILDVYGAYPNLDATKALLQFWKYTYLGDTLSLSKEEQIRIRTAEVQEELKKIPLVAKWGVKGKLVSVRPTHAEFELKKKDGSTVVTSFSYDFNGLTAEECAIKIVEYYLLGHYTSNQVIA